MGPFMLDFIIPPDGLSAAWAYDPIPEEAVSPPVELGFEQATTKATELNIRTNR